jgi:small-conductance mechanosensitive channel
MTTMLRKWLPPLLLVSALLLQGCSALGGVNDTLSYTNDTVSYINKASDFAQQLPEQTQQAVTDPDALAKLETELQAMQADIVAFKDLKAPEFAAEIDQQLTAYSDTLNSQISGLLEQAKLGAISMQALEQSQIMQTASQITKILEQVQQLGS